MRDVLLFITKKNEFGSYPIVKGEDRQDKSIKFAQGLFYYAISPLRNELSGFKIGQDASKIVKLWNFNIPAEVPKKLTLSFIRVGNNFGC